MDRTQRQAITEMQASFPLKCFVEAMMVPRLCLWMQYVIANDRSDLTTPEQRQEAQAVTDQLGDLIIATGNSMLGTRRVRAALPVLKTVMDAHFGRYGEGKERKSTGWLAVCIHRFGDLLLSGEYLPPWDEGSPIAESVNAGLAFATQEDVDNFDKYATKAAKNALSDMQKYPWGLYRKPFSEVGLRSAAVVAATCTEGTIITHRAIRE